MDAAVPSDSQSSQPSASGQLPLMIPEGIRYNCQCCGRCCGGWAVGLTEADWAKVKDVDWGALKPELAGSELFVHREEEYAQGVSGYPHYTRRRPDGFCSFLFDGKCFIHASLGEDKKPGTCKLFPYTFVPTPGGIYVGCLYGSQASVRNQGELLSNQRPMLEQLWQVAVDQEMAHGKATKDVSDLASHITADQIKGINFQVSLTPGVELTWDEYKLLDASMIAIIQGRKYKPPFELFAALEDVLIEAQRLKSEGQSFEALSQFVPKGNLEKAGIYSPGFFENLLFHLLCFRSFEWYLLREKFADEAMKAKKNVLFEPKIITSSARAVYGGKVEMPPLGVVDLGRARKLQAEALDTEIEEFFYRYLYLKIFSKGYCGTPMAGISVVAGFNLLVGNLLSAICYAKAHAIKRGAKKIEISDLWEAYFLLDRENVSLSQLPRNRAQIFDLGFGQSRLFRRLLAEQLLKIR